MAHRVVKKATYQPPKEQHQPYSFQPETNNHRNSSQPPSNVRPIIETTDQIIKHDKSAYRKSMPAFPPAESLFTSHNNYDAGPYFIRTTSAVMMGNPKKRIFPYGAWITPFGSDQVHSLKVKSPLRCSRCKAYVNPHFRFDGTKSSVICNICGIKFSTEPTVDPKNIQSSEVLTEGVIDFVVSDPYYIRKRTGLIKLIIAVEINLYLWETGILHTIIQSAKSAIENTQFPEKVKIGIIFYNNEGIKFQKLRKSEEWKERGPLIYEVKNSSTGMCCPLSDEEMLLDPNKEKQKLIYLLDQVIIEAEKYCNKKSGINNVNYGMLLKCLMDNFTNQTGRVMLFTSSDPRSGLYPLRARKQQQNANQLKPLFPDYYNFGRELAKNRIGVDMYMFSKDLLLNHELATTHFISSLTGGTLTYYPSYSHENNSQHLYYKVYSNLTKNYVYDVDFTVRVSNGLNICGYGVGQGFRESRDICLGMMDPSTSVSVSFEHQEKIEENSSAYLQYAMMYTTGDGERKIRAINYRYPIVNQIQTLYEAGDYLTMANILCREYLSKLSKYPPQKVREEFINKVKLILQEDNSSILLHPNILPMLAYIHSIINSKIFLNVIKSSPDIRITEILKINSYNFAHFANKFYPKLFPINMDIYEGQLMPGDYIEGEQQEIAIIPANIPLLRQSFSSEGLYLYHTPEELLILVMNQTPSQLLVELFGTQSWEQIEQNGLPELQTSHNIRINIIINELRRRNTLHNGIYLPVAVRTPLRKGPFNDLIKNICKQNYDECNYNHFINIISTKK